MTGIDRREFLRLTGLAGFAALTGCRPPDRAQPVAPSTSNRLPLRPAAEAERWSDSATWASEVPGPGDVAVVSKPIVLDTDVRVSGVVIEPGGSLSFDPSGSVTLESSGNVVVRGSIHLRPSRSSVRHQLRFADIDERRFMGAATTEIGTDIGLWVQGAGLLDVWGSPRLPWTRVEGSLSRGDTQLSLIQDPVGWEAGDELVVLPTAPPGSEGHQAFEERTVATAERNVVRLDRPLDHEHPLVDVGRGRVFTAEVLNLTRNVILSGTPEGRSHVIITGHGEGHADPIAQTAAYFRLEHMGPYNSRAQPVHFSEAVRASEPVDDETGRPMDIPVLARWPFHFHHLEEASRGSRITGAVAYRPSSHAFVAHQSHGVMFESCIAYDAVTSPFWWDGEGKAPVAMRANVRPPDHTRDGVYRHCVAARVRMFEGAHRLRFEPEWAPGWGPDEVKHAHELLWPPYTGARLGGFTLIQETGMVVGGVAAGVEGTDSAGVVWPAGAAGHSWKLEDLVVHNNQEHGTFGWHNTTSRHEIHRLVSYHNVKAGVFHGAYANPYQFADCITFGNGTGVEWHANAQTDADLPQEWSRLLCHGAWEAHKHGGGGERPTVYRDCEFRGELRLVDRGGRAPSVLEFVDCSYRGRPLRESDLHSADAHPGNRIEVRTEKGTSRLSPLPALPLPEIVARQ